MRNLREVMRKGAEKETIPLQQIAEQEVRRVLLTAEALAVLLGIKNIDIISFVSSKYTYLIFYLYVLSHNLIYNRRQITPPLSQSSHFFFNSRIVYQRLSL